MKRTTSGFTIVELLIIVVVIAILAVISVVAYQGVQQRATNAAIVDAASKSLRAIQAYIAINNGYPAYASSANICITTLSSCVNAEDEENGSTAFDNAMSSIGALPRRVPQTNSDYKGIYITYNAGLTLQGESRPMLMVYYLSGISQNCGVSNVVQYSWPDFTPSTTGYSSNISSGGVTRCWVSIPGPGV